MWPIDEEGTLPDWGEYQIYYRSSLFSYEFSGHRKLLRLCFVKLEKVIFLESSLQAQHSL